MVQSDIPKGQTSSGKINARWYLQRLKASANQPIRFVRGYTQNQQQKHIPTVFLQSPSQSFISNRKKSSEKNRSNSLDIKSASSLKSLSTVNPSLSELNCQSENRIRRPSSSNKSDILVRPPSTPVDQHCQREYSTKIEAIQRATCQLLGPDLCCDCIENRLRSNLSQEYFSKDFVKQKISSLAIRSFLPNSNQFDDQQILQLIQNQQIQFKENLQTNSILTDQEYFQELTKKLQLSSKRTPFSYRNFQDFISKYQSNQYPRLLLSQNPSPTSSNQIFQQDFIEKFEISKKYSFMKKSSQIKYDFNTNLSTFISPKKSKQFYNEHRYLTNFSPPLLKHSSQQQFTKKLKFYSQIE